MILLPPRSTRTDTLFPTRRSSDLVGPGKHPQRVVWLKRHRRPLPKRRQQVDRLEDAAAAFRIAPDQRRHRQIGVGLDVVDRAQQVAPEIGRASWRERVCQSGLLAVVAIALKKKKTHRERLIP